MVNSTITQHAQNQWRMVNNMKMGKIVRYKATFFRNDGDKEHNLGSITFITTFNRDESLFGRAFRLASLQQQDANRVKIEEV